MKRKSSQEEGLRIIRNARKVTDCALNLTDSPADYTTLLLTVLGNGIAAFCQEESDEVFEKKLATVKNVLDEIARDSRARLTWAAMGDPTEETRH